MLLKEGFTKWYNNMEVFHEAFLVIEKEWHVIEFEDVDKIIFVQRM